MHKITNMQPMTVFVYLSVYQSDIPPNISLILYKAIKFRRGVRTGIDVRKQLHGVAGV